MDDAGSVIAAPRYEPINIGARTWVGEGAIIMADIGSDSIVSAGAVVIEAMPSRVLIGGNPAKKIKELG